MAMNFDSNLFSSHGISDVDTVLEAVQSRAPHSVNEVLGSDVSLEEVRRALFAMGAQKAPGPDGMPALFFQKHWGMLKNEILSSVQALMNGDEGFDGVNDTTIVLIPKNRSICLNSDP